MMNNKHSIFTGLSPKGLAATSMLMTLAFIPNIAYADEHTTIIVNLTNLWLLIASLLVFIMHLGFATLETGLTRAKNSVNVLYKNLIVLSVGFIIYGLIGYGLMFPDGSWLLTKVLGFSGLGYGIGPADTTALVDGGYSYWTGFIFQAMFAVTAGSIVSGAVAERIRLPSFCLIIFIYLGVVYPIIGSWTWGGGWLSDLGFYDFAGSTIVHAVGGWCALVVVLFLGPRHGKYTKGKSNPIYGHNIPLAYIGMFLLWFGWFGFNGGSALSTNPQVLSQVFLVTMLGACAGVVGAAISSIFLIRSVDLSMVLNGVLAGLVSITAGADAFSPLLALLVGLIGGVLVVIAVLVFDRLRVDDPVGAIPVHLVVGIWGTLAVGIFGAEQSFIAQSIGVLAVGAFCVVSTGIIVLAVRLVAGLRVARDEELKGLDIAEHRSEAYKGFQIFTID